MVSALHFGTGRTPPEHAAVFQLFSVDEWKQIAKGGGRLRELTERLVPGFQPDLLRAQLEVMRGRSERRLGAKFEKLLGQSHRFKEITPELLADYISAGDPNLEGGAEGERRNYSDITRSADLYFDDSPFAFPITLIDTPGTNDPFLVRDEITRRSLENPDIYVFVLSALQPLSAADIAMMRLLNGLHKDRIIVFINRVDQLANPAVDATIVRRSVKKRLRLEFPNLHIPVIIGSAWLGGLERPATPSLGDGCVVFGPCREHRIVVPGAGRTRCAGALDRHGRDRRCHHAHDVQQHDCRAAAADRQLPAGAGAFRSGRGQRAGSADAGAVRGRAHRDHGPAEEDRRGGEVACRLRGAGARAARVVRGNAGAFRPDRRVRPEHHAQRVAQHRARLRALERRSAGRGDRERRVHQVLAVQRHAAAQRPGDCLPGRVRGARQGRRPRRAVPLSASAGDRRQPAAGLSRHRARGAGGAARRHRCRLRPCPTG